MDEREITEEELKRHEQILKGAMSIKRVLDVQKTMMSVDRVATVADVEKLSDDKDKFTHGGYMKGGGELWRKLARNVNM